MTLLSHSPDLRYLDSIAEERGYTAGTPIARFILGGAHDLLFGDVDFEIINKEGLPRAVEETGGGGFIVAADHINNMSVPAAALAMGRVADVIVPIASTNYDDPLQNVMYRLADIGRGGLRGVTYPVPYETVKNPQGDVYIAPLPFSSRHYDELVKMITGESKVVVAAAHNPNQYSDSNDGRIPQKPGVLVPHLALASRRPVLPSLLQVEGQIRNPDQLNDNKLHLPWILGKKAARLTIGDLIIPDAEDCDRYCELLTAEQSRAVTEERQRLVCDFGHRALGWMRDNYNERFALGRA